MRITFLGTCSGTEPMPGRRHCSFVIEHHGAIYWFDAGESCSYTAHLAGIDLLSTHAIFISHTHMDHIGGLPNLLWNLRKLNSRVKDDARRLSGRTIKVFIPDLYVWRGIMQLLNGTEGKYRIDFTLDASVYEDGPIYEEHGFRVIALHNLHLGEPEDHAPWKSFSFRIEAADHKSVVYSGDVASIADVDALVDHCDLLLMETGHHKVEDICQHVKNSNKGLGQLGFIHHGRAILSDPHGELQKARSIMGDRVFIADDGTVLDL